MQLQAIPQEISLKIMRSLIINKRILLDQAQQRITYFSKHLLQEIYLIFKKQSKVLQNKKNQELISKLNKI